MENNWIRRFRRYPGSIRMNEGADRQKLAAYGKERGILFPEDYLDFMEAANGVSFFSGRVELWKIPVDPGEMIPRWKSMEHMNSAAGKAAIPFSEHAFLIGRNELGDYTGITYEEDGYEIIYISPDMGKKWYFRSFQEWLADVWREWKS